jgi:hypothetical protein
VQHFNGTPKMAVKQVIEGRYIDRVMLVNLLERTFGAGRYEFRVSEYITLKISDLTGYYS